MTDVLANAPIYTIPQLICNMFIAWTLGFITLPILFVAWRFKQ